MDHHNTLLSVAPMLDRTDRHCRYFFRLLAPGIRLYTEMIVAQAILYGNRARLLDFDPLEHPVALQLGGSEPQKLAEAAAIGIQWGYDEINLNIGCPSDRVQSGSFGACLMSNPALVADCVSAIADRTGFPASVKTRIGIDDHDQYEFLRDFIGEVAAAGCRMFIVHARKAILSGLSPRENRTIPPLRYDVVYRLKREFPHLRIILNGGIRDSVSVGQHLQYVDGVMIGREAYSNPYWLAELQAELLPGNAGLSREQILLQMQEYAECQLRAGIRLAHIGRHVLGLYAGQPGARHWRRFVMEQSRRPDARADILQHSLECFKATA
jgi:tRNA-dihydrouridine synthase A